MRHCWDGQKIFTVLVFKYTGLSSDVAIPAPPDQAVADRVANRAVALRNAFNVRGCGAVSTRLCQCNVDASSANWENWVETILHPGRSRGPHLTNETHRFINTVSMSPPALNCQGGGTDGGIAEKISSIISQFYFVEIFEISLLFSKKAIMKTQLVWFSGFCNYIEANMTWMNSWWPQCDSVTDAYRVKSSTLLTVSSFPLPPSSFLLVSSAQCSAARPACGSITTSWWRWLEAWPWWPPWRSAPSSSGQSRSGRVSRRPECFSLSPHSPSLTSCFCSLHHAGNLPVGCEQDAVVNGTLHPTAE